MKLHPKVLMQRHGRHRAPRILSWDVETAANEGRFHSLYNERGLPTNAITKERYIICGSWKFLGEDRVDSACVTPHRPDNDRPVIMELHRALSSADAVVAHYGDKFDMRRLNARIAFYKLTPLPPIIQIDTYKIAKDRFDFNSNRLDFLGRFLGLGCKISTNYHLWDGCAEGDANALRSMVKYNQQDVRLLERVFLRLYPFTRLPRLDVAALDLSGAFQKWEKCGHCGGLTKYRGDQLCRTRYHQMFQCIDGACGAWRTGPVVKAPEKTKK